MKKSPIHQSIIDVLSRNPGVAMSENDIISAVGVIPSLGARAIYDLRTAQNPEIERVQGEDGLPGARLVVDPLLAGIAPQPAAQAPAAVSTPVAAPQAVATPAPVAMSAVSKTNSSADDLPEINGFKFGTNKIADEILSAIKLSGRTGADILEEMAVAPDAFLKAYRELESKGLIVSTELELGSDSETVFYLKEEMRDSIVAALSHDFDYEGSVEEPAAPVESQQPRVHLIASGSRPAAVAASPQTIAPAPVAPPAPAPVPSVAVAPKAVETATSSDSGKLGAVALREERQRKEAITEIIRLLSADDKPMPKTDLFDKVVPLFTVRGLKDLLKDLIDDGTLEEVRDGKNKFVVLGTGKSKAEPAPKAVKAPEKVEPQDVVQKPQIAAASAPEPVPAAVVAPAPEPKPEVAAAIAPQPVRPAANKPPLPSVSELMNTSGSREAADLTGDHESGDLTGALLKLVERVRQLEAENRVYRDMFANIVKEGAARGLVG